MDVSTNNKNIVILISGRGSNMVALAQAARAEQWQQRLGAQIACVISNRADAGGLLTAAALGLPTQVVPHSAFERREAFDAALQHTIDAYTPKLVVLAGFMRILTPGFVQHYAGRLINIHPSVLPAFTGLNTHQRARDAGCTVAGATVHQVTTALDGGPILAQMVVPVLPGDTAATLATRVQAQEHVMYPKAVGAFLLRLNKTNVNI